MFEPLPAGLVQLYARAHIQSFRPLCSAESRRSPPGPWTSSSYRGQTEKGRTMQAAPRSDSDLKLLLVVNRDARVLLPIRISPVDGHRAALAVSRDDHARSKHNFAALFRDHMNGAVVYLFHRAHVFAWISGGWILFSVKFSRPLAVRLCAVRRGALDRDLNVFAGTC